MRKIVFSIFFFIVICTGIVLLNMRVPQGFLPDEDQGYFFINVQLPNAASLERTSEVCKKIEEILSKTPGVEYYSTIVGYSLLSAVQTSYNAFFFVSLTPWHERPGLKMSSRAIQWQLNQKLFQMPEAIAFSFSPPAIPGIGTSSGVTMILQDKGGNTVDYLGEQTQKFMDKAKEQPEIANIMTTLIPSVPQIYMNVDRDKVLKQGVDLSEAYQTLQAFLGGYMINFFNRFGLQWQVYVQADGEYRNSPENVGLFYIRNKDGDPVPLTSLLNIEETTGPEFTMRFNLYRSAQLSVIPAQGYSTTQVMNILEKVFEENMPGDMGFDYSGMSFQEEKAQKGISPIFIFGLSLLFVFLILAAQYESWSLPFSVLLGTPIAVFGAFFALALRGMQNNLYAQIGMVMLIGLAAKNAILIVEFAKAEYESGKPLIEATLAGARLRLRPILMTAFAFILGCLPLWFASGSGAVSRQILGTTVIGGMLAASAIAIFFIPFTFYLVERISQKKKIDSKEEATS